jgi:hypothetical protein
MLIDRFAARPFVRSLAKLAKRPPRMRAEVVSDFIVADHWPQADILEPLINARYRGKADIALACRLFDPNRTSDHQIASAIRRALLIYLNALSDRRGIY